MSGKTERIALFVDLENFIGFCIHLDLPIDLTLVVRKLSEFGRVAIRRSYGDLHRAPLAEAAKQQIRKMLLENLFQHEDIPHINRYKNTADIRLVVDALSTAYQYQDVSTFAVVAYDRDYMPLFSKLREIGRTIIGIGGNLTSANDIYVKSCDVFIYFETLFLAPAREEMVSEDGAASSSTQDSEGPPVPKPLVTQYCSLLLEAIRALEAQGRKAVGAAIVPMMRNLRPDFDVSHVGLNSFRELAAIAAEKGLLMLSPYGLDILATLAEPESRGPTRREPTAVIDPEDREGLAALYQGYINRKLKVPLPPAEARMRIYHYTHEILGRKAETGGISLWELSQEVTEVLRRNGTEVRQDAVFKILYGLFRARCFLCTLTSNPYDPLVQSSNRAPHEFEPEFVRNFITIMRREVPGVPLDPASLSMTLYGTESYRCAIAALVDGKNGQ